MERMNKTRLGLESLEVRENPAVTFSASFGILTVTSDAAGDTVRVTSNYLGQVMGETNGNGSWQSHSGSYSGITRIVFNGNAGNDSFTNLTNIPLTADGGAGADT